MSEPDFLKIRDYMQSGDDRLVIRSRGKTLASAVREDWPVRSRADRLKLAPQISPILRKYVELSEKQNETEQNIKQQLNEISTGRGNPHLPAYLEWLWTYHTDRAKNFCNEIGLPYEPIKVTESTVEPVRPATPQPKLSKAPVSSHHLHFSNSLLKVIGRDKEQAELRRFASADAGFKWLQLAGTGGQGKSRLANELILQMPSDWRSGFLRVEDLANFSRHWGEWLPTEPHLVVIDYIVGRESELAIMLRALMARQAEWKVAIRILIVERQRWDGRSVDEPFGITEGSTSFSGTMADWFVRLNSECGYDDLTHADFRFEAGLIQLGKVTEDDLLEIVHATARTLNKPISQTDEFITQNLRRIDRFGRPLFAYLVAISLADNRFGLDWDKAELLDHILQRDWDKRWTPTFSGQSPYLADDSPELRLAVLATMIQSADCRLLESKYNWPTLDSSTRRRALTMTDNVISGGARGPQNVVAALEPDIIGEWFVICALENDALISQLVDTAWKISPRAMSQFLVRIAQDFPLHTVTRNIIEVSLAAYSDTMELKSISSALLHYLEVGENPISPALVNLIRSAARDGDAGAMNNLGYLYAKGLVLEKNVGRAIIWYARAARKDHVVGLFNLSHCYLYGHGIRANSRKALEYSLRSAEMGDPRAANLAGIIYLDGLGVKRDYVAAASWFSKSVAGGNIDAIRNLADCLFEGLGVEQDVPAAIDMYHRGIAKQDPGCMTGLGLRYHQGVLVDHDFDAAFDLYRRAANLGFEEAIVLTFRCMMSGLGTPDETESAIAWLRERATDRKSHVMLALACALEEKDDGESLDWLMKSSEIGSSHAMHLLSSWYAEGHRVDRNFSQAYKWSRRSALAGFTQAFDTTGYCLIRWLGGRKNEENGFCWCKLGAQQGDPDAMLSVAYCYANGVGINKNTVEAARWYKSAAENEVHSAMASIGLRYLMGDGVEIDKSAAKLWFEKCDFEQIDDDSGIGIADYHALERTFRRLQN